MYKGLIGVFIAIGATMVVFSISMIICLGCHWTWDHINIFLWFINLGVLLMIIGNLLLGFERNKP